MSKVVDHTGEIVIANNGQRMQIIQYRNSHDIDVRFEDGTVVEHKSYSNFKRGGISNPNNLIDKSHLGEVAYSEKYRMNMTIIAFRKYNDLDVRFDDGFIAEHKSYNNFISDSILNKNFAEHPSGLRILTVKNERLGQKSKAKNGQMMTIIAYRGHNDVDIQFEDGVIVTRVSYSNFLIGNVRNPYTFNVSGKNNPRWNDRTGETAVASNGQKMTIIRYGGIKDIDIQFEDGTIVTGKAYNNFSRGLIENPNNKRKVSASEKIGMHNKSNVGLDMEIIEASGDKVVVKFEDGTTIKTSFSAFKSGQIRCGSTLEKQMMEKALADKHVGEKWKDSNGEEVTIVARVQDRGKNQKWTVRWENGQELNTTYHSITHAMFSRKHATKVGLTSKNKNGETITIIRYSNSHDMDVQFEDGTIIKNVTLSDFYRGYIRKTKEEHKKLREICQKLKLDYNSILSYKRAHPELSYNQVIIYYRPDLIENIFGELIPNPLYKGEK